jgi:hypothetical protein
MPVSAAWAAIRSTYPTSSPSSGGEARRAMASTWSQIAWAASSQVSHSRVSRPRCLNGVKPVLRSGHADTVLAEVWSLLAVYQILLRLADAALTEHGPTSGDDDIDLGRISIKAARGAIRRTIGQAATHITEAMADFWTNRGGSSCTSPVSADERMLQSRRLSIEMSGVRKRDLRLRCSRCGPVVTLNGGGGPTVTRPLRRRPRG